MITLNLQFTCVYVILWSTKQCHTCTGLNMACVNTVGTFICECAQGKSLPRTLDAYHHNFLRSLCAYHEESFWKQLFYFKCNSVNLKNWTEMWITLSWWCNLKTCIKSPYYHTDCNIIVAINVQKCPDSFPFEIRPATISFARVKK